MPAWGIIPLLLCAATDLPSLRGLEALDDISDEQNDAQLANAEEQMLVSSPVLEKETVPSPPVKEVLAQTPKQPGKPEGFLLKAKLAASEGEKAQMSSLLAAQSQTARTYDEELSAVHVEADTLRDSLSSKTEEIKTLKQKFSRLSKYVKTLKEAEESKIQRTAKVARDEAVRVEQMMNQTSTLKEQMGTMQEEKAKMAAELMATQRERDFVERQFSNLVSNESKAVMAADQMSKESAQLQQMKAEVAAELKDEKDSKATLANELALAKTDAAEAKAAYENEKTGFAKQLSSYKTEVERDEDNLKAELASALDEKQKAEAQVKDVEQEKSQLFEQLADVTSEARRMSATIHDTTGSQDKSDAAVKEAKSKEEFWKQADKTAEARLARMQNVAEKYKEQRDAFNATLRSTLSAIRTNRTEQLKKVAFFEKKTTQATAAWQVEEAELRQENVDLRHMLDKSHSQNDALRNATIRDRELLASAADRIKRLHQHWSYHETDADASLAEGVSTLNKKLAAVEQEKTNEEEQNKQLQVEVAKLRAALLQQQNANRLE